MRTPVARFTVAGVAIAAPTRARVTKVLASMVADVVVFWENDQRKESEGMSDECGKTDEGSLVLHSPATSPFILGMMPTGRRRRT